MSYKVHLSTKDRIAGRFLAQLHSVLSNAFFEAKQEKGLTQRAICEELATDKAVISRILSGAGNPTARTIAELASAMGYRPEITLHKIDSVASTNQTPWQEVEKRGNSVEIVMIGRNSSRAEQNIVHIPPQHTEVRVVS
jgi:transcriptional regulator with XRE-family HTH domain